MEDAITKALRELREAIEDNCPTPSREKSIALTKLDECRLWLLEHATKHTHYLGSAP